MNTNVTVSTPVAPRMGDQGSSTPGGHVQAWRAQKNFDPAASFELISATNPWRAKRSAIFFDKVLAATPAPTTIGQVLANAEKLGFKAGECQRHLRWLYTWGGSYIRIGGQVFTPPPAGAAPAVATPKASRAKAPAKAKS
jgi:hypothetical protein